MLKVISGSTFDLQPMLQTVVDTAIRLCRADQSVIFRNEGGEYRWAAGRGNSPEYEQIEREIRFRPGTGSLVGRTALEGRAVHIVDAQADPLYELKSDAEVGGVRTLLGVPLFAKAKSSALSASPAGGSSRLPKSKSSWCRPLPTRR